MVMSCQQLTGLPMLIIIRILRCSYFFFVSVVMFVGFLAFSIDYGGGVGLLFGGW